MQADVRCGGNVGVLALVPTGSDIKMDGGPSSTEAEVHHALDQLQRASGFDAAFNEQKRMARERHHTNHLSENTLRRPDVAKDPRRRGYWSSWPAANIYAGTSALSQTLLLPSRRPTTLSSHAWNCSSFMSAGLPSWTRKKIIETPQQRSPHASLASSRKPGKSTRKRFVNHAVTGASKASVTQAWPQDS